MLLLKVRHIESTPDTEKTFTFVLGLDETEKSPGSKVERLHLEWQSSFSLLTAFTVHLGSSYHAAFNTQHCQLPKERGNASWCQWPHKTQCTIFNHGDKTRRICHQLMYQGCVWGGGPSGSPSASEERCGHAEQCGSQAGWLQTMKQTGSFTTLTLEGCLGLRKSNDPQRVKKMTKTQTSVFDAG